MPRIFSGIQPTGELHIGNYLGAVKNWVRLQTEFESIFCIVDYHAIITAYEPAQLKQRRRDMAVSLLAVAIMAMTVWPMAWRWQRLLAARGIRDRLAWLVRAYFTAYTAGQILPTSIGGDAMRIYETARRHPAGSLIFSTAVWS